MFIATVNREHFVSCEPDSTGNLRTLNTGSGHSFFYYSFTYTHHRNLQIIKREVCMTFLRRKFALQTVFILSMTAIDFYCWFTVFVEMNTLSLPFVPSALQKHLVQHTRSVWNVYNSCHCLLFNKSSNRRPYFWLGVPSLLRRNPFLWNILSFFRQTEQNHRVKILLNISLSRVLDPL